jgi:hypothetical protein
MRFVEPIVINGINKDVAPNGLDYSGRKILNPVRDVLNGRYLSSEVGEKYQLQNLKGHSLIYNTYVSSPSATGQNNCIGAFEDPQNGNIIWFIRNSDGYHRILRYIPSTGSTSVLMDDTPPSVQVLNFQSSPRYLITGVAIIGNILIWTDNFNNQRYINITRSYGTLNDFKISLMKIGPRNKPTFTTKSTDSAQTVNRICDNSFQFAFRYVYVDNEVSVLSPFSALLQADAYGIDNTFKNTFNRALISHTVDTDVSPIVKRVELLFRVGNGTEWRIWKKVTSFSSTINEYFYNNTPGETISTEEATKIFDNIPNKSKALTVFRNRVFLNVNEEGFAPTSPTISATRTANIVSYGDSHLPSNAYIKKNGAYGVGIVAYDRFGIASGIVAKTFVNGAQLSMTQGFSVFASPTGVDSVNASANRINVTVSGSGLPLGKYSIALTPELQYENYIQTPAVQLFYRRERGTGSLSSGETEYNGKVFNGPNNFVYIYLVISDDVPFVPDNTYFVRIVNRTGITIVEKVLDVFDGNILVVGNFGVTDWTSLQSISGPIFVEIFKLKNTQNIFYYEVAGPFSVGSSGIFSASHSNIQGDTYYRGANTANDMRLLRFRQLRGENGILTSGASTVKLIQFEQPTPIYTKGASSVVANSGVSSNVSKPSKSYIPDYTKSAWSQGRPFVEATSQVLNKPSTIRFSDPYIEGSQINGLNSFGAANEYNKIGEDASPITRLIGVGNVLVAVHERNITTLYVGEGVVKTGDTGFLSQTDSVVGDDRKLIGNMGSYHPESVQEVDGMLFGFDIFLGVVWRYSVAGLHVMSRYGMESYFRDKAVAYLQYKDSIAFVSGVDKYHKEYLITLPNVWFNKSSHTSSTLSSPQSSYNISIDPSQYTVGEVYQIGVKIRKSSGLSPNDNITVSVTQDGVSIEDVSSSLNYLVNTSSAANASELIYEFVYSGASSLVITLNSVSSPVVIIARIDQRSIAGETWAFNYEENKWSHRASFVPEYMVRSGNSLFSFKNGRLWKHNASPAYNLFYGKQYKRKLTFSCNPKPGTVISWSALQIAGDNISDEEDALLPPASANGYPRAEKISLTGTAKVFEATNEFGQATYTRAKEFEKKGGVYYGPILKDTNTNPSLLSAGQIALRDGKDMRSKSLEVTITNDSKSRSLMQKINIVGESSMYST